MDLYDEAIQLLLPVTGRQLYMTWSAPHLFPVRGRLFDFCTPERRLSNTCGCLAMIRSDARSAAGHLPRAVIQELRDDQRIPMPGQLERRWNMSAPPARWVILTAFAQWQRRMDQIIVGRMSAEEFDASIGRK